MNHHHPIATTTTSTSTCNYHHYRPPPHSATSCSSSSGVCAPVGGRKKTTITSCNRWHHHGARTVCANGCRKNATSASCSEWPPPCVQVEYLRCWLKDTTTSTAAGLYSSAPLHLLSWPLHLVPCPLHLALVVLFFYQPVQVVFSFHPLAHIYIDSTCAWATYTVWWYIILYNIIYKYCNLSC